MKRNELRFQQHIIKSYASSGGYATKWSDQHGKGKPDLICSHPILGVHLVEAKHVPEFGPESRYRKTALQPRQLAEAHRFVNAGGMAFAAVVAGSSDARGSMLAMPDATEEIWYPQGWLWVPYETGKGFNITKLLLEINTRRKDACK